jgi:hypothetical protein
MTRKSLVPVPPLFRNPARDKAARNQDVLLRIGSSRGLFEPFRTSDVNSSLKIEYQLTTIVTKQPATPTKKTTSRMRMSQIRMMVDIGRRFQGSRYEHTILHLVVVIKSSSFNVTVPRYR